MSEPDSEAAEERRKRTVWLLLAGAASLVLPLLAAAYLHWSAGAGALGPSGRGDVFERRENGEKRIIPSQSLVPTSAMMAVPPPSIKAGSGGSEKPGLSSLDFIKQNTEISENPGASPKPAPAAQVSAPVAAPTVAASVTKAPAAKQKKSFVAPKLQPTRGFSSMNGANKTGAGAKNSAPAGAGSQDFLKNIPPEAANNPQLQEYLKQHPQ